jgi:hypothetical protein
MVLKNYRTLANTQTWDGTAQTVITQLPRDFLAQRYIIDMNSPAVSSIGGVSVLVVDSLLRCITNIKIVAVGEGSSRTIAEISGRDLYHLNTFDYGAPSGALLIPTTVAGAGTRLHMGFCIDFRCNKLDPDDYSVALPTYLLSSLQLEITYATPTAVNYGTNFPTSGVAGFITNMTTTITCVEGIPEAGEDFSSNPLMTLLTKSLTGDGSTGTLESFDTFFQVGALIRRDFICTETTAGVRSDLEISNFQVNSGTIPLMSNILFTANKAKDVINYRIATPVGTQEGSTSGASVVPMNAGLFTSAGYTMIDFNNNRMPFINTAGGLRIGGLSTVGYNTGDLVFQANKNNVNSIIRRVQETVEG